MTWGKRKQNGYAVLSVRTKRADDSLEFVLHEKQFITNLGHFMTMGLPFPSVFDILTAKRGDRNGKNRNLR